MKASEFLDVIIFENANLENLINDFCKDMGWDDYTINENNELILESSAALSDLQKYNGIIPISISKCYGRFNADSCNIKSLYNFPRIVEDTLSLNNNAGLKTLKYAPTEILGNISLANCGLEQIGTDLTDCVVGRNVLLSNNIHLTSLEGFFGKVNEGVDISFCPKLKPSDLEPLLFCDIGFNPITGAYIKTKDERLTNLFTDFFKANDKSEAYMIISKILDEEDAKGTTI